MNDRFCTKYCDFSDKSRLRCEGKMVYLRDGIRRRRFAVEPVSNYARNEIEGCSGYFLFFGDNVLLCFTCIEVFCALELAYQSDIFYS